MTCSFNLLSENSYMQVAKHHLAGEAAHHHDNQAGPIPPQRLAMKMVHMIHEHNEDKNILERVGEEMDAGQTMLPLLQSSNDC